VSILVLDSAPLSTFARARQLEVLDQLLGGDERVTTTAVVDELRDGLAQHPELQDAIDLPWLKIEALTTLEELRIFAEYTRRLGSGAHDIGEATVLAWAEVHQATAFTDDEAAAQIGRERRVRVVRTLALVARGVRRKLLTEAGAERLVDDLLRGGGRFPLQAGEFIAWARDKKLL
jgi:predicted nucleic acid-binding protein